MSGEDLKHLRILVADPNPHNFKLLRGILGVLGITDITAVEDSQGALIVLNAQTFDAIFVDEALRPHNPVAFSVALRHNPTTRNQKVPIILMSGVARQRQVELARDCGANDLIVRPLSVDTVSKRLRAALFDPKPFVAAEAFQGPDRRRKQDRRSNGDALPANKPSRERRMRSQRRGTKPSADAPSPKS